MTLTHLAISSLMTSLMMGTADPLVVSVGATAVFRRASFKIDDPEQMAILAKPQQLATAIKQGRKLEFSSCPLTIALNLLREQWGSGQVRIRVVIEN